MISNKCWPISSLTWTTKKDLGRTLTKACRTPDCAYQYAFVFLALPCTSRLSKPKFVWVISPAMPTYNPRRNHQPIYSCRVNWGSSLECWNPPIIISTLTLLAPQLTRLPLSSTRHWFAIKKSGCLQELERLAIKNRLVLPCRFVVCLESINNDPFLSYFLASCTLFILALL